MKPAKQKSVWSPWSRCTRGAVKRKKILRTGAEKKQIASLNRDPFEWSLSSAFERRRALHFTKKHWCNWFYKNFSEMHSKWIGPKSPSQDKVLIKAKHILQARLGFSLHFKGSFDGWCSSQVAARVFSSFSTHFYIYTATSLQKAVVLESTTEKQRSQTSSSDGFLWRFQ